MVITGGFELQLPPIRLSETHPMLRAHFADPSDRNTPGASSCDKICLVLRCDGGKYLVVVAGGNECFDQ